MIGSSAGLRSNLYPLIKFNIVIETDRIYCKFFIIIIYLSVTHFLFALKRLLHLSS